MALIKELTSPFFVSHIGFKDQFGWCQCQDQESVASSSSNGVLSQEDVDRTLCSTPWPLWHPWWRLISFWWLSHLYIFFCYLCRQLYIWFCLLSRENFMCVLLFKFFSAICSIIRNLGSFSFFCRLVSLFVYIISVIISVLV